MEQIDRILCMKDRIVSDCWCAFIPTERNIVGYRYFMDDACEKYDISSSLHIPRPRNVNIVLESFRLSFFFLASFVPMGYDDRRIALRECDIRERKGQEKRKSDDVFDMSHHLPYFSVSESTLPRMKTCICLTVTKLMVMMEWRFCSRKIGFHWVYVDSRVKVGVDVDAHWVSYNSQELVFSCCFPFSTLRSRWKRLLIELCRHFLSR